MYWWEIGMTFIDGHPYYPMFDLIAFVIISLVIACVIMYYHIRKQKEKIDELQNLVDYYYYEDLIK